jgi:RNA polymerase sigma factor (sigma-70 family)
MPNCVPEHLPDGAGQFPATHWSAVLAAGRDDDTRAQEALAALCRTYWYPLYAFVRRQGHGPEDAQDLTQAFFANLLEHRAVAKADPARGRFRTFLLSCLRHFLANERVRAQAQKRGGGCQVVSLDAEAAETRFGAEPLERESPDRAYERNWALALMEQVLQRLRAEQAAAGKAAQFERLRDGLMGEPDAPRYADLAAQLGLSTDAVKMAVSRLRGRYRELLREEIARTVNNVAEVEEEIRHLFAVLAN